ASGFGFVVPALAGSSSPDPLKRELRTGRRGLSPAPPLPYNACSVGAAEAPARRNRAPTNETPPRQPAGRGSMRVLHASAEGTRLLLWGETPSPPAPPAAPAEAPRPPPRRRRPRRQHPHP